MTTHDVDQMFAMDDHFGMHDAVLSVTNKSLSLEELKDLFRSLPKELQEIAFEWGLGDTEFRERVAQGLERGVIRLAHEQKPADMQQGAML